MMTTSRIMLLAVVFTVAVEESKAQDTKPRMARARTTSIVAHPPVPPLPLTGSRGGASDECASAVEVMVGCEDPPVMYDAASATGSMDPILCGGLTSSEARDLWFTFVATSTGTAVRVEGTRSFDPVIEVFEGACDDLEPIGCADETYPSFELQNTSEQLAFPTRIGSSYYVRVYSFWEPSPVDHTFTFCVFEVAALPANDVCSGAVPAAMPLGGETIFTGDNTNASNTEGLPLPSLWHAFSIAECQDITIDLCGTTPAFLNWSTGLFLDCPATRPIFPSFSDTAACADGNVSQVYSGLPPGTYYYPVFRDEAEATRAMGPYTVHVSAVTPVAYCKASFSACDETIGRVTIGSIDNPSDCQPGPVVDHTAMTTDIVRGEGLAITVENGGRPYAANSVSVWVDWDQDSSFCGTDELFVLVTMDEGLTFTGNVQAPSDALPGSTRMRVRMGYEFEPLACGVAEFGEIEEYTVNVVLSNGIAEHSPVDWSVFPNPNDGRMTVRHTKADADMLIELFDVSGRSVHQVRQRSFDDRSVVLELAGVLAAGSYTMSLSTMNGRDTLRVIVR